jgi:hypothetical protein
MRKRLQRAVRVARLDIDATHRLLLDEHPESRSERVERGVLDAVVGGQPADHDLLDLAVA